MTPSNSIVGITLGMNYINTIKAYSGVIVTPFSFASNTNYFNLSLCLQG